MKRRNSDNSTTTEAASTKVKAADAHPSKDKEEITTASKEEKKHHKHSEIHNDHWHKLCQTVTVKDLCKEKHRKLVTVDKRSTVRNALKILNREKILSAPIVDHKEREFLGFVDVLDIVGFVLATWRRQSHHLDDSHFPGEKFFDSPITDVLNFSDLDYPVFVRDTDSLGKLIDTFRDPKNFYRLHRVAVVDSENTVVNVLSQSDIVAYASKHIGDMPEEKRNMLLGVMQGLIRSPIMIRLDTSFVDALEKLYKNRISGLALIDHEFKLCGNLSASDLRGMNPDGFDFFFGSTLQFLAKGTTSSPKRSISVQEGNTFGEVIKILSDERIHRIYITSSFGHPIGFVSLIDVIARL